MTAATSAFANLVGMQVTGAPLTGDITLGSVIPGFLTPSGTNPPMVNGGTYTFEAIDGTAKDLFRAVYNSGPGTLTGRVCLASTNSNADVSLSSAALIYCTVSASDVLNRGGDTMQGALILSGDPGAALGAATKQYVDAVIAGIDWKDACYCATTVALTATYANGSSGVGATLTNAGVQAAFSVDGQTPAVGQPVLVKNQASAFQNGRYVVTTAGSGATNWVLTRATDFDTVAEIFPGALIPVEFGTTNAGSIWLQTATVVTIGSDSITFTAFAQPATYVLKTGDTMTGALNWAAAVTIASHATTADIGAAASNLVILSGTATITGFPTAASGIVRKVRASGAFTLTQNPTSLIIPGAANYTAAVGDIFEFTSEGGGNWRMTDYTLASGLPIVSSSGGVAISPRTANTILGTADKGTFINITSGSFTQTFSAVATLGADWWCYYRNAGTGVIALDPNSTELIDTLSTYNMYPGECRLIQCNGSTLTTIVISAFAIAYTASDTFIMPPGYGALAVDVFGGGGGGGSGRRGSATTTRNGGGGGGGGARVQRTILAPAGGTSVSVTVGASAAGGAAQSSNDTDGSLGVAGNNSSFGSYGTAFGGGRGAPGTNAPVLGGSGGGSGGAGSNSTAGGLPSSVQWGGSTLKNNLGGGGGGATVAGVDGGCAEWGGGAGGGCADFLAGRSGGSSIWACSAGGGGGCADSTDVARAGGAAGLSGSYTVGGGAAGGATSTVGTAGSAAANDLAGNGGGGGGGSVTTTAGTGGAGSAPGGGGGGGGASLNGNNSGAGGASGRGEVRVYGLM